MLGQSYSSTTERAKKILHAAAGKGIFTDSSKKSNVSVFMADHQSSQSTAWRSLGLPFTFKLTVHSGVVAVVDKTIQELLHYTFVPHCINSILINKITNSRGLGSRPNFKTATQP